MPQNAKIDQNVPKNATLKRTKPAISQQLTKISASIIKKSDSKLYSLNPPLPDGPAPRPLATVHYLPHTALPAATAEAQAHWKLNPPSHPVTSTASPIKNSPGTLRASMVRA